MEGKGEERRGEGKRREGRRKTKSGYAYVSVHRQTHTHRHTEVKTVYPPVSLRSLGGYN